MTNEKDDFASYKKQPRFPSHGYIWAYPQHFVSQENYMLGDPNAVHYHWMQQNGNFWNHGQLGYPTSTSRPLSHGSATDRQMGICLEPCSEDVVYPIIICGKEESIGKLPSYAQVTKKNTEPMTNSFQPEPKHKQTEDHLRDSYGTYHRRSPRYDLSSYISMDPFGYRQAPENSSIHINYDQSYATHDQQTVRKKIVPCELDDYTRHFQQITSHPLNQLFIGCRFKETKNHEGENKDKCSHLLVRPEFTLIALPVYHSCHFHELGPIDLCEFNLNLSKIIDNMLSVSTLVIPFGSFRKVHPSPHCFLRCADFGKECERLGIKGNSLSGLDYENDAECKDVTRTILNICKGQLDFLKHISILQAMRDGVDLMLLYFLVYDCFRSDFIKFEIEFRSIQEAPSQIVIRSSRKNVCKRKAYVRQGKSGIDFRVAHGTIQWRDLPDASLCTTNNQEDARIPSQQVDTGITWHSVFTAVNPCRNRTISIYSMWPQMLNLKSKCSYLCHIDREYLYRHFSGMWLRLDLIMKFPRNVNGFKESFIWAYNEILQMVLPKERWDCISQSAWESVGSYVRYIHRLTHSTLCMAKSNVAPLMVRLDFFYAKLKYSFRWKNVFLLSSGILCGIALLFLRKAR